MKNLFLLSVLMVPFFGFAQSGSSDMPPMIPGKCYAKCYIPDVWETKTEEILVKEASSSIKTTPPVYETQTEQILVKEASKKLVPVPAVYDYVVETRLVKEATTVWVEKQDKSCLSENPNDCIILCAEERPAKYESYKKRIVKTPATIKEIEIPAVYKKVTKQVIKTRADKTTNDIPAEYNTVSKKVLVTKGGYTAWKEVVCGGWSGLTKSQLKRVQQALVDKEYNVGSAGVDGILGRDTREALLQYQKDNNLPQGQLDVETMKHLGAYGM